MKRIACIDLGSNAIRFIVYEFHSLANYQVLYKHRAIIRLGSAVFSKGQLDAEVMRRMPEILFQYQTKARELQVHKLVCVATSAVREASNGKDFLDKIHKDTGLEFRALTGTQEARLLALALQWNKPAPHNLIYGGVDIGGGSTEIFWYTEQGYIDGISMPIGTVRVLENFCEYPLSEKAIGMIRSYILANSQEFQLRQGTMIPHRVFGISGLLHCIFDLMHKGEEDPLQVQEIENFIAQNHELTPPALEKKFNIEKNRSEILLPGCVILHQLMVLGGFRLIYRAQVGLRDGVAIEQMISEGESFKSLNIQRIRESTLEWAYTLLDKYAGDMPHAQHVEELTTQLYHAFSELGLLPYSEEDLMILRVATILHDIGQFITYSNHHAHSRYIIDNTQCPYLRDREYALVSNLAYHHRKAMDPPRKKEDISLETTADEFKSFQRSLAIMRLADALDRQHRQLVSFREVKKTGNTVEIIVEAMDPDGVSEEIRMFTRAKPLFEEICGVKLTLTVNCCSPLH